MAYVAGVFTDWFIFNSDTLKELFSQKKRAKLLPTKQQERQKYRFMDDICYLKNQSTGLNMSVYPEFAQQQANEEGNFQIILNQY